MGYRPRSTSQYNVRHLSFRQRWEMGLAAALRKERELRSQGWYVERGALTESQAKRMQQDLEKLNFETQTIPITDWQGEQIQFLAYKPKPGAEKVIQPAKPRRERVRKEPVKEFQRIVWGKQQPSPGDLDDGFLMSPDRTMAVLKHDATPQATGRNISKLVDEITQNPDMVKELDYKKLVKAERVARMQKRRANYVSFNVHAFSIDKIKKALRVLGTRRHGKAYLQYGKPLVVQNPTGDSVLIAEAVKEPTEPDVVSIITIHAL